jgi:hypothetical protein
MSKHPDIPDAKAVLAVLAKLGRTEFSRSDIRFAGYGDHKQKRVGGVGYIGPVIDELKARGWIERVAHNRYCVTERGREQT